MMRDRRDGLSIISFSACLGLLLAAPAVLLFNPRAAGSGKFLSAGIDCDCNGPFWRRVICIKGGDQAHGARPGAVALRMHQFSFSRMFRRLRLR